MDNKNKVAVIAAVDEKLPKDMILHVGDTVLNNEQEQVSAIRAYIRAKILKQYGVNVINGLPVSVQPLSFSANRVGTNLKLPKVSVNPAGEYVETLEAYYKRCLPTIRLWFKNSLFNSAITVEQVEAII